MMKHKKGLIIAVVALLTMAFLIPVYAQSQNCIMEPDRDQECEPKGPATRTYGEDPPAPAQEEKPEVSEETLEEVEGPLQEQTQTREQLGDCNCENEDCEEYQYQYQHQHQYKYRHGQEEQD